MLKNYELLYILHPDLEGSSDKITEKVTGFITKSGGEVTSQEDWGKRKLAYPIAKNDFGVYILLYFTMESGNLPEVERDLKLSEEVMRFMVVTLPEVIVTKETKSKGKTQKSKVAEEPKAKEEVAAEVKEEKPEAAKKTAKVDVTEEPKAEATPEKTEKVAKPKAKVQKSEEKTEKETEKDRLKKLDEKLEEILGE